MRVTYCIIGAGPTGLGAAWRLAQLGENDFVVLERDPQVGGLAASFTDSAGFTWDVGGHVVFSHYPAFDALLDELLGADVLHHQRESWIRVAGTFVPYPFQNNIRRLPPELAWECVEGLLQAGAAMCPEARICFRPNPALPIASRPGVGRMGCEANRPVSSPQSPEQP